jgi:nicotinamide riboside transporter PnuC
VTDVEHDPFDRATEREHEMREQQQKTAAFWARQQQQKGRAALQLLAVLLVWLPFHLWLVEWNRTGWVMVHLVAITITASIAAARLIGRGFDRRDR